MVDPDYDNANVQTYLAPRKDPLLQGYSIHERFWFDDDGLVHVGIEAVPLK
ncbi:MAG: hypothetical protein ABJG88_10810 [Litorimonas sp.]